MQPRARVALSHVFLATLLGLTGLLALLFYLFLDGSRRAILESAERLREGASLRIATRVEDFLYAAEKALEDVEAQIAAGAVRPDDAVSVETGLLAVAIANENLAEVTLTRAMLHGHDAEGAALLGQAGRWQVSVFRELGGGLGILKTRVTRPAHGGFRSEIRAPLALGAGPGQGDPVGDPTLHLTFRTPASASFYGRALWTELHYTELDSHLPEERRRVVVTVMKAVEAAPGTFLGVVRAGLLVEQLGAVTRLKIAEDEADDPHRVFLCDDTGGLVARLSPEDRLGEVDGHLRVLPAALPSDVAAALKHEALGRIAPARLWASGAFAIAGRRHLVTFRGLARTQGWRVGIVVPEDHYLGDLQRSRDRGLFLAAALMGLILVLGSATLRAVRQGLGEIVAATARMRGFDFAASASRSSFREVAQVMDGLERAKTALRALGKYVPVDLVRLLYESKREPVLGGELLEVSVMFTDIKDFTALSERLTTDELARTLGRYLEVMTGAVHSTEGVIDKYIGDSVMAIWNAPSPHPEPARAACRAALACLRATGELFASPEWSSRPRLETRIGLNRDTVMVGHFGAPDRMSYTALGDGVNLASRLEGLNKAYGTTVLASEAIREAAGSEFAFRLLDLVAVKGKTRGVRVYELIGRAGEHPAREQAGRVYELAFEAYLERRFEAALRIAEAQPDDPPSRVLEERCRAVLTEPPPPEWDGTYISRTK